MTATIATFILLIIYSSFSVVLAFTILALNRKNLVYIFLFFLLQVFYVLSPAVAIFNVYIEYLRLVVGPIKVILTPLIFFHIKGLTQTENKITLKESLHFIPAVIVFIITLIIYFGYPDWKVLSTADFYKAKVEGNFQFTFLIIITRVIVFFQGIFYALMIYKLFKRNDFTLRQFVSDISKKNMIWIRSTAILVGIRGLTTGAELFGAYSIPSVFAIYYVFLIGFSFYIFFQALVHPDITFVGATIPEMNNPAAIEYTRESKTELRILEIFKEKRLFLRPELTLQEVSDELSVPKHRLTQLIKSGGYSNFYAFVNEHRIDFSKELLINLPNYLSVDSVVVDSGFQHKSTFYRVFKEATGLSPKEFKEMNSHC
ncbi:MAG: helix-turn-helix domain-containing protein [Prolixibacteraceae bacterium]|nr:helix-turn-helix domain-containing protein [Prolixibacteraceae bacterium]